MTFVTFEDFQVRFENTVPAGDEERVAAFLEDACSFVTDIVGAETTAPWGDGSGGTTPGTVVAIVCTAVRRAYENPLGLAGETIGDYSWSAGGSAAGVYFTDVEKRALRRAAGHSAVQSLVMRNPFASPDGVVYIPIEGSEEPVPWIAAEDQP